VFRHYIVMPKALKTYTIDVDLAAALKTFADGRSMSALVEEGIRLRMGMPLVPGGDSGDPNDPESTGSERRCLEELREMAPGWHSTADVHKATGISPAVCEKSLRTLARRGKVYRWGDGRELSDGTFQSAWGMRPGMDLIRGFVESCKGDKGAIAQGFIKIQHLAFAMDNVEEVRQLMGSALCLPPDSMNIENCRENIARRNAVEREAVAAWDAGKR
jgi:hypothetical protein